MATLFVVLHDLDLVHVLRPLGGGDEGGGEGQGGKSHGAFRFAIEIEDCVCS